MGCVQGKSSSESSPRNLENLKSANGYVPGGGQLRSRTIMAETVPEKEMPPLPSQSLSPLREISVGEDELVDGWPRWLVKNIPKEVLAGLVPKSADSYSKIDKVGQGTYSNVYKARDKDTGKIVALKKVRFDTAESESVKFMAREIMILQKLDHPNVLKLEGLATSRMHYSIYLVFNFMQSDLTKIISRPGQRLTEPQIKCYMHQLLSGLQHCHERGILHRDIKGSNLLIDADGVLKIGDFGLANHFNLNPKRPLTNRVVTLWYRAPELLLGSTDYGVGIDLWSAGCLLAEMFFGRPVLPGRTEVEQLHRIFKLCGSPSGDYWKRLKISANFRPPQPYKPNFLETFKDLPLSSQNLLINLLALDPHNRGTAASGLQSEFFSTEPLACHISDLPVPPNREWNETNLSQDRKKHASFATINLHAQEEDHDQRIQNQTMLSNQMEKAGIMGYHQQQEDASGPNPYNAPDMILLSPPSSLGTEPYSAPSEPKSDPSAATQRYAFEKLPSSSSLCRCSEKDQTPSFSMEMRSSSTSEYFSFSANWAVNFNTTVD